MYARMPFDLSNARATFQRAMDVAFIGQVNKFVVIYLDDITIFSKSNQKHLKHLMKVFERCRKLGISLNPKNSICYQIRKTIGPYNFKRRSGD